MDYNKILPTRISIGYANHRFILLPNEISLFLLSCNDFGLETIGEISDDIEYIADVLLDGKIPEATIVNRHLKLLRAVDFLIKGAIQEE